MERRFEIVISSTEHHTWQGILQENNSCIPFQSELELLVEMERRINGNDGALEIYRKDPGKRYRRNP